MADFYSQSKIILNQDDVDKILDYLAQMNSALVRWDEEINNAINKANHSPLYESFVESGVFGANTATKLADLQSAVSRYVEQVRTNTINPTKYAIEQQRDLLYQQQYGGSYQDDLAARRSGRWILW